MKKKEKANYHAMTVDSLAKEITELRNKLYLIKINSAHKPEKNTRGAHGLRIQIARLLTIQREKQLAGKRLSGKQ